MYLGVSMRVRMHVSVRMSVCVGWRWWVGRGTQILCRIGLELGLAACAAKIERRAFMFGHVARLRIHGHSAHRIFERLNCLNRACLVHIVSSFRNVMEEA